MFGKVFGEVTKPGETNASERAPQHVLLIDDDEFVLHALRRSVGILRNTWNVVTADSGEAGLLLCESNAFDVVISDMSMPKMHGREVLGTIRKNYPDVLRIALTGWVDEDWKIRKQTVAQVFLSKPCSAEDVIEAIEYPERCRPDLAAAFAASAIRRNSGPARKSNWDDGELVIFE